MKKSATATEEIVAYFSAFSGGRQRVKASKVNVEFPSKGPLDKTTARSRVEAWASHQGLKVECEGDDAVKPEFYIFTKLR